MNSPQLSCKRNSCDEISVTTKKLKTDVKSKVYRSPTRELPTLLQRFRSMRSEFKNINGTITGDCVFCMSKMSFSWFDWAQHFLKHTAELRFYCTACSTDFTTKTNHGSCSIESIIDVYGACESRNQLEGFICKLCDYMQINDYRLLEHFDDKHREICEMSESFKHVTRIVLVPDIQPQKHVIQSDFVYVESNKRYQCGVGNCSFHAKTSTEFKDHFRKMHSIMKTFYCPHCKLLINRMSRPTVPMQEILDHIESHGRHLYQCIYCSQIMLSESDIRIHLIKNHSDLPMKFWHNKRKTTNKRDKCELIEILFDCSFCDERVNNTSSAYNHFELHHSGFEFDFKTIKMIKITTNDLNVICSIDDSNALNYREVLKCGACDDYFLDKNDWFEHFDIEHQSQQLTVKRDFMWLKSTDYETTDEAIFDRNMLYFCASCKNSSGIKIKCSTTINNIYTHWKRSHKYSDYKPFRFYVTELVVCNYCDVMCPFHDLNNHITNAHPNKVFVALKAFEFQKKCALCRYSDDNLIEHFQNTHHLAIQSNVFNPISLNTSILWKLLKMCVHKKVKCEYCDMVFETRDIYRDHHSDEHTKLEQMYQRFFDTESIWLIGDCCHSQVDPNTFFDHLICHKFTQKCDICSIIFNQPLDFFNHQRNQHNATDSISSMYRKFMQLLYMRSEHIFGNGLILNKFNTLGTEFDYSNKFEKYLERFEINS